MVTSLLSSIVIASSPTFCSLPSCHEFNTRLDSIAKRFNNTTYSSVHLSGRRTQWTTVFIKCLIFSRVLKITEESDYYLCHVCLSVDPSARQSALMELSTHWTNFGEILYLGFLRKFVDTKILVKTEKKIAPLHQDLPIF